MNYGTIGFLGEGLDSFYFAYPKEILSAFSLSTGSKLYGKYYPCPANSEQEGYRNTSIRHDFIITPIPYELWKVSARIKIQIDNSCGTLNKLYEYLKNRNISVIHAESSRSSYRFSSWSAHIVFGNLLDKEIRYNEQINCCEETQNEVDELKKDLSNSNHNFMFVHNTAPIINIEPNSTLSYFADFKNSDELTSKPFELVVVDSDISLKMQVLKGDETFINIMSLLKKEESDLFPAATFSELDTKGLHLRTVPISEENAKRFFKVSIKYLRNSDSATCTGIVSAITNNMSPNFSIWHSYNRITTYDKNSERGEIIFLIEDLSEIIGFQMLKNPKRKFFKLLDNEHYALRAFEHFQHILEDHNSERNSKEQEFEFTNLKVLSLPKTDIIREVLIEDIKSRNQYTYKYDVFISYSHNDIESAEMFERELINSGLKVCRDERDILFGENISDTLLIKIKECREMCTIISDSSLQSKWVERERAAAWILDKFITAVVLNKSIDDSDVSSKKYIHWNIDKEKKLYIKQVIERRNKAKGIYYNQNFPR